MAGIKLIDEIILQSSYIDSGNVEPIEYVALSYDAFLSIKEELEEELDETVKAHHIDDALTIKHFIIPGLRGVQYKFFREVVHA